MLKEFIKDPLNWLLALVIIGILTGVILTFFSPQVQKTITDEATDDQLASEKLEIPILDIKQEAQSNTESATPENSKTTGQIASGISITKNVESDTHAKTVLQDPKPSQITEPEEPILVERHPLLFGNNLYDIKELILKSPDVVSLAPTQINGNPAYGYTTNKYYKHNVVYIEGSDVVYLMSRKFIDSYP